MLMPEQKIMYIKYYYRMQVSKEAKYKDIDLTLSGHTHGMQFGIEIPGFKWSPVQYIYKYWSGLYKQDNQYLYVNRGLGFLGYPGRLGIWPEITVIELVKG
jgi:predicted MPP superfamily phosphohydrolase